jgi:hypothetical protein
MTCNPLMKSALTLLLLASLAFTQTETTSMTQHAAGTFDVKLTPLPPLDPADTTIGRFSGDKRYHGDLEATSLGEMLSAGDIKTGNAVYTAMERVTGTLRGRQGSFVLQHTGVATNGDQQLKVIIVPGSGTGELAGISMSSFKFRIEKGGQHFYEFDYTLPPEKR